MNSGSFTRHPGSASLLLRTLFFFITIAAAWAQDAARMAEVVKIYAKDDRFMGSALVAKDGAILFEQSAGWANAEWKIANTATTKFRLGSITKQFTAAAILLLAEDGKLGLDDALSKFVPSAPETWRPVTIRQLLSHTGGIPSITDQPEFRTWKLSPHTPEQSMARIADKPLEFTPGEKFKYSNTGYQLLGWIVELASGQKYDAFLKQRIFTPLGMNDSGYDLSSTVIPQRASGYMSSPQGLVNAPYVDMHVPAGAGALYSTTRDLALWTQGLFGGKLLKPASLELMTKPVQGNYALGVSVNTVKGRKVILHGGGIEGFNTQLSYYPEAKLTVVVLANINGQNQGKIATELAAVAFGDTVILPTERKEIEVPAAVLQRYVGVYQLSPEIINTIRLTDGRLTTQLTRQQPLPLFAESETKFFLKIVDAQVEFFTDEQGRVTHLVQYQGGREIKGTRVEDSAPAARP
ncbi:MAG: serine hydrolase [Verrucomicrobiota bacterium]